MEVLKKMKDYHGEILDVFYEIAEYEEFDANVESEIRGVFYHTLLKCKRNFIAIKLLIDTDELDNGYVEAIPLLRIMAESYLHYCFITDDSLRETALSYYELSRKKQLQSILNNTRGYRFKFNNPEEKAWVKQLKLEMKKEKIGYNLLGKKHSDILEIAKLTDNMDTYNSIYIKYHSYVHFNPTTYISFGTDGDNNTFDFGKTEPNYKVESEILYYANEMFTRLMLKLLQHIGIEDGTYQVSRTLMSWVDIKKEYGHELD